MKKSSTKILLIEDNPGDIRLVQEALAEVGDARFDLTAVKNLSAGFEYLENNPVEAILLDLTLPDSAGFATFEKVRERVPQVAIILLTGMDDDKQATKAVREGAQDYLVKGRVSGELLARSIRYSIERKQAEATLLEKEKRLRAIYEGASIGIAFGDLSGRFIDINPAIQRILGYSVEELSSKTMADITHPDDLAKDFALFQETLAGRREYYQIEKRFYHKDGHIVWGNVHITIVRDANGNPEYPIGMVEDITERKQAEEALEKSEKKYRQLHESMIDGFVSVSMDGKILESNELYRKMLGYSEEELAQLTYVDITPEKWHAFEKDIVENQILKQGFSDIYEKEYRRKDGTVFPVELHTVLMRDDQGKPSGMWAIARDISERKQTHETIELLRHSIDVHFDGAYWTDGDNKFIYINDSGCKALGYEREELIGKTFSVVNPRATPEALARMWQSLRTNGSFSVESVHHRKDGSEFPVEIVTSYVKFGGKEYTCGFARDITRRNQAESALRKSEENYRGAIAAAGLVPYVIDYSQQCFTFMGENILRLTGYSADEITPAILKEIVQENYVWGSGNGDLPQGEAQKRFRAGQIKKWGNDIRIRTKSGEDRWLNDVSVPLMDEFGKVTSAIGVFQDLTERKLAEAALLKSDAKYRLLANNISDVIWIFDLESTCFTYISPSVEQLRGYTVEEVLGQKLSEAVTPATFELIREALPGRIEEAKQGLKISHRDEIEQPRKDGTTVWTETTTHYHFNEESNHWELYGVSRDITERKHTEAALAQQAEELRQRNEELARLYGASVSLLSGSMLKLDDLAQTIIAIVLKEFGQSNCSLLVTQKGSNNLLRLAVAGPYAEQVRDKILTLDGDGVVPEAIRTGKLINTCDVSAVPGYLPNWISARSELTIPLIVGTTAIGAIDVQSSDLNAFSQDDERLMEIFAERAALAIEHSRLNSQTESQLQQLLSLRTIDMAISSSFDINLILNIMLDQITSQLGVHAVDILVFNAASQTFKSSCERGFRTRVFQPKHVNLGTGYAWRVVRERKVISIPNINSLNSMQKGVDISGEGFLAYLGFPLISKGQVKGVLEIFQREQLTLEREQHGFLEMLAGQAAIAIDNTELFEHLQTSNAELTLAYNNTLEGWANALELRDKETEGHTRRVTELTTRMAHRMGVFESELVHVYRGALLHDIGKMGIPDNIVLKPGSLTDEEWVIMRKHPQYAFDMLQSITFLQPALDIPYCHHEKWDGSGYPRGLKGNHIPLVARIFALADVWDALTSDRPYRKAWSKEQAVTYFREQSGKHFDPTLVSVFLNEITNV